MVRRKSMMKKKGAAAPDTDTDSDSDSEEEENENPNRAKGEVKLGRAKSIKAGARTAKEMKYLEEGMDDFLKNKQSDSWFGTLNNNAWDAFRKSVESLRTETEATRGALKDFKKYVPSPLKKFFFLTFWGFHKQEGDNALEPVGTNAAAADVRLCGKTGEEEEGEKGSHRR